MSSYTKLKTCHLNVLKSLTSLKTHFKKKKKRKNRKVQHDWILFIVIWALPFFNSSVSKIEKTFERNSVLGWFTAAGCGGEESNPSNLLLYFYHIYSLKKLFSFGPSSPSCVLFFLHKLIQLQRCHLPSMFYPVSSTEPTACEIYPQGFSIRHVKVKSPHCHLAWLNVYHACLHTLTYGQWTRRPPRETFRVSILSTCIHVHGKVSQTSQYSFVTPEVHDGIYVLDHKREKMSSSITWRYCKVSQWLWVISRSMLV